MGLAAALPAGLGTPWQLAREATRRARRLGAKPLKKPGKGGALQETGQSNCRAHANPTEINPWVDENDVGIELVNLLNEAIGASERRDIAEAGFLEAGLQDRPANWGSRR